MDIPGEVFKAIVDGAKAQVESKKALEALAKDVHHLRKDQKGLASKKDVEVVARRTIANYRILKDPNNPYLQAAIKDHVDKCHPSAEVQQVRRLQLIKEWVLSHKAASAMPPIVGSFLYYLYKYLETGMIPWP